MFYSHDLAHSLPDEPNFFLHGLHGYSSWVPLTNSALLKRMRLLTPQITTQNGESLDGESGGSGGTVAIDLNQVSEGTLAHEGTILLTGEDGSQSKLIALLH